MFGVLLYSGYQPLARYGLTMKCPTPPKKSHILETCDIQCSKPNLSVSHQCTGLHLMLGPFQRLHLACLEGLQFLPGVEIHLRPSLSSKSKPCECFLPYSLAGGVLLPAHHQQLAQGSRYHLVLGSSTGQVHCTDLALEVRDFAQHLVLLWQLWYHVSSLRLRFNSLPFTMSFCMLGAWCQRIKTRNFFPSYFLWYVTSFFFNFKSRHSGFSLDLLSSC